MPVIAQGCRSTAVVAPAAQPAEQGLTSRSNERYDSDEIDRLNSSTLNGAIAAAQQTRALQTSNAAAFLAATNGSGSGKHKYAGKNVSIGETNGYITDKGLFKKWSDGNLMTNAGKYGCPASTAITPLSKSGYTIPENNSVKGDYDGKYGAYVGAKIASSTDDPLFMGSDFAALWDNSESSLPACGNEGSNVQVVYPAKATGAAYRGTYNALPNSDTKMILQTDMSDAAATYPGCKERAEQRGSSVFGLSTAKCYIGDTLDAAQSSGIAFTVIGNLVSSSGVAAQKLHFGADGTLNLYNSLTPTAATVVQNIGLTTPITTCDFANGGLISEAPIGTYGSNCNSILEPYLTSVYIGTW